MGDPMRALTAVCVAWSIGLYGLDACAQDRGGHDAFHAWYRGLKSPEGEGRCDERALNSPSSKPPIGIGPDLIILSPVRCRARRRVARGASLSRRDRLAASAAAVGCRRARGVAEGGYRGAACATRRRPEFPGPLHRTHVVLRPGPRNPQRARPRAGLRQRDHALSRARQGHDDLWRLALCGFCQGPARVGDPGCAMRLCAGELQTGPYSQARRSTGYYRRSLANASIIARLRLGAHARPARAARDQPAVPRRRHRSARDCRRTEVPAAFVRRAGARQTHHLGEPAGTRRAERRRAARLRALERFDRLPRELLVMGHHGMAVVDDRLRVHGLEALRVIDASVMPAVSSTNTNAPTIMIAEKGAAMIKANAREKLAA